MYHSDVQTSPSRPSAGEQATLRFSVKDDAGRVVSDLPYAHEQAMHVMIVSRDLRHFAHVHPSVEGESFRLEHTFSEGGEYVVVVDYQEPGRGQVVDKHRVEVEGPTRASAPLEESTREHRADGIQLSMMIDRELRAGEGAMLRFTVTDAETGEPVDDLELYLGARAHFMALSEDGEKFVHIHALECDRPSALSAHAVFPQQGLYKLWVQVQRRGAVVTVPFVLRVGARKEVQAAHGHHKH
jgi:Cu+-exporting ATPase